MLGIDAYKDNLKDITTADDASPETFNPLIRDLLNNDVHLKNMIDPHVSASAPHSGHALTARNILTTGGLTGGGNLSADRTLSIANDGVTDDKIGIRNISDTTAPTTDGAYISTLFNNFAFMIKQITGKLNWKLSPATNLESANTHANDTTGAHGATSAATANKIIMRDINSRAQVADPVAAQDIASKAYVDAAIQGISVKQSCRVATTANITLSGLQSIDGISVVTGDRVLVKNQTSTQQNGIYVASTGTWSRASDANTATEVLAMFTFISEGSINADSGWFMITNAPITLDTTALNFTQFSGAGQVIDGVGLVKTGNQLDVNVDNITIEIVSDQIRQKAGGTDDSKIGNRTVTDTTAPTGDTGTLTYLISSLGYMIKNITGKTNWRNLPDINLATTKLHIDAAAPHSGHETPGGAQIKVDTHANLTNPHYATPEATPNRIIMRDASGRAQVAAPTAASDIARKDTVDAVQINLNSLSTDYSAFKGNLATLQTTAKNDFPSVINELFTSVVNGKESVRLAINGKGGSVPVNPTFTDLVYGVNSLSAPNKIYGIGDSVGYNKIQANTTAIQAWKYTLPIIYTQTINIHPLGGVILIDNEQSGINTGIKYLNSEGIQLWAANLGIYSDVLSTGFDRNGNYYVLAYVNSSSHYVYKLTPNGALSTLLTFGGYYGSGRMAVCPDGSLWYTMKDSANTIMNIIKTSTSGSNIYSINYADMFGAPIAMQSDDNNNLYIVNPSNNSLLYKIDASTYTKSAPIVFDNNSPIYSLYRKGQYLYATTNTKLVAKIRCSDFSIQWTTNITYAPGWVKVHYVTDGDFVGLARLSYSPSDSCYCTLNPSGEVIAFSFLPSVTGDYKAYGVNSLYCQKINTDPTLPDIYKYNLSYTNGTIS